MKKSSEIAKLFGCSQEQLRAQYAKNASQLYGMADAAALSGCKVNGYTEAQLRDNAASCLEKSRS